MTLWRSATWCIIHRQWTPQIIFTSPRIDANDLYLNESNYTELKQRATERLEAIRHYILSDNDCRSQMLLTYFGETSSSPCDICDHCIQQKKTSSTSQSDNTSTTLRTQLLNLLKEKPYRAEELIERVGSIDEDHVRQLLHELVDQHIVSINDMLQFKVQ